MRKWIGFMRISPILEKYYSLYHFQVNYHSSDFAHGYTMVYPHKDEEGRTVIWTRFNRFHKSDLSLMLKQYVIYVFEKCDRETSNQAEINKGGSD